MARLSLAQQLGLFLLGREASRPAALPHTLFTDIGEDTMEQQTSANTAGQFAPKNSQTFNLNGARATLSVTIQYPDNLDADHLDELKQYFEILHQSLVKKAARAATMGGVPTEQIVHPARNTLAPEWKDVTIQNQG